MTSFAGLRIIPPARSFYDNTVQSVEHLAVFHVQSVMGSCLALLVIAFNWAIVFARRRQCLVCIQLYCAACLLVQCTCGIR